ncbi:MAG: ABC transporter permease [Planctomycetota bacterium]
MSAWPVVQQSCLRTWRKTLRRPVILTFSFVQPLLWMVFFGFLFARYPLSETPGLTYLDYLAPGVSVMTVLFGASQSGIGLIRDLQTGFLVRLWSTPTHPGLILAGKLLADVLRLLVQALLVLALASLLGARLQPAVTAVPLAVLALVLFAIALCSLSCLIALLTRAQEGMAVFVHLVNMPLLFTSTALVPSKHMPDWLARLCRYNPLTLAVDAWRDATLFGRGTGSTSLGVLALLAAVLAAALALALGRSAE